MLSAVALDAYYPESAAPATPDSQPPGTRVGGVGTAGSTDQPDKVAG